MRQLAWSTEGQYCTACCPLAARCSGVRTSRSCTVPVGVVHHVPRSRMWTVSPCARLRNSRPMLSAVMLPPNPEPITTTVCLTSLVSLIIPSSAPSPPVAAARAEGLHRLDVHPDRHQYTRRSQCVKTISSGKGSQAELPQD